MKNMKKEASNLLKNHLNTNTAMTCVVCVNIQAKPHANILSNESLSKFVEKLEDFGYYGDDEFMFYLKKCPRCGAYYKYSSVDTFGTGGGVSESIEKIDVQKATQILEKVIAELQVKKHREKLFNIDKLKKELKILKAKAN